MHCSVQTAVQFAAVTPQARCPSWMLAPWSRLQLSASYCQQAAGQPAPHRGRMRRRRLWRLWCRRRRRRAAPRRMRMGQRGAAWRRQPPQRTRKTLGLQLCRTLCRRVRLVGSRQSLLPEAGESLPCCATAVIDRHHAQVRHVAPLLCAQVVVSADSADEAAAQLQTALSRATPVVPPLLEPLVVAGPFGSGKRGVLAKLARELLPGRVAAPPIVTTKERPPGAKDGAPQALGSVADNWTALCPLSWRLACVHAGL